jgi:hypothetical protein
MTESISNFTIKHDYKSKSTRVSINNKIINNKSKRNKSYIVGYQYSTSGINEGEYIKLSIGKKHIQLGNDCFSAYPVYVYRDNVKLILSNTIIGLTYFNDIKISISRDSIYEYFTFGYIPFRDNIIYKDISLLAPNSIITIDNRVSIKSNSSKIFNHEKPLNDIDILYDALNESIINKTSGFNSENSVFCLTSGEDSMLGGCLLRNNDISTSTATFGKSDSKDIIKAKARANELLLGGPHHQLLIDELDYNFYDFHNLSIITGGLSTSSNIYLYLFAIHMKNIGYRNFYYCDHYEALRRLLKPELETIISHTTPIKVVNKYFTNLSEYKINLSSSVEKINSVYFSDPYMEYYLFEKYIKTSFYKNIIHNAFGTTKITLPLNYNLLKLNNNYINTAKSYSFEALASKVNNKMQNNFIFSETKVKTLADFSFSPRSIIKEFEEDIINVIDHEIGNGFEEYFDLNKMIKSIKMKNYVEKEEWFILRILNLFLFKQAKNVGMQ